MNNEPEQHTSLPIGTIGRWNGVRWEPLTGAAATEESNEAFSALYDLLTALTTFDQIDLAHLALASSAAAWQQALEQGTEAYQQLEALMDYWAKDLNNAVLREQEAQRDELS